MDAYVCICGNCINIRCPNIWSENHRIAHTLSDIFPRVFAPGGGGILNTDPIIGIHMYNSYLHIV
jgi:hypothetical protein